MNGLWTTIEEARERIRSAPRTNERVLILGAGMAGMGAAYELLNAGKVACVHVVEARHERDGYLPVGGRLMTHRFGPPPAGGVDDRPYHELGGMRFPEVTHDYTWKYLCELGLPMRRFHSARSGYVEVEGKRFSARDPGLNPKLGELYGIRVKIERDALLTGGPSALLDLFMTPVLTTVLQRGLGRKLIEIRFQDDAFLREIDKLSALDFLTTGTIGGESFRAATPEARALLAGTTGYDMMWNWSLAILLRASLTNSPPSPNGRLFEIVGGADRLPYELWQALETKHGDKINFHFGTKVTGIRLDSNGHASVSLADVATGQPVSTPRFDRVLCTVPFSVLRDIALGGLSSAKANAIRGMSYASSAKVLLRMKDRFWERQGILGGSSITDRVSKQIYYPSDWTRVEPECPPRRAATAIEGRRERYWSEVMADLEEEPVEPSAIEALPVGRPDGVVLGSYTWSEQAREIGALPREAGPSSTARTRREQVVLDLENLHQEIGGAVSESASIFWDTYPWAKGAFALTRPGELTAHYQNGRRREGNLYFAGDHVSIAPGWVQGALESSLAAAFQMLLPWREDEGRAETE